MNVYEAMGRIVDYAISYLDIVPDTAASNEDVAQVCQMLDAYDVLAPDWAKVKGWVQYYAICSDGTVLMSETDIEPHDGAWVDAADPIGIWERAEKVDLPLGIDWRLCKWARQEVTK